MKKCIFTATLVFLSCIASYAHVGLADWEGTTPGGNEISNYIDSPMLSMKNGENISGLTNWYFYKNHIICLAGRPWIYIVDERSGSIDSVATGNFVFSGKLPGELLASRGLSPKVWTRWYSSDWHTSIISNFILIFIFGFIVSIPLILLFFWLLYKAIRKKMRLTSPYTIVVLATTAYLLIDYLLDIFPQSI